MNRTMKCFFPRNMILRPCAENFFCFFVKSLQQFGTLIRLIDR